jgi:NDP-sugar pyrophosphorylase family protein
LTDAIVMAAGEGVRLRPVTERWPKPLLPIDGRPVLGRLVRALGEEGFARAFVVTGHLGDQLERLLGDGRAPATGRRDRDAALDLLHAHDEDDRVLVVGHEPDFSQVVHDLTGGRVDFKKGGVAVVREARGSGELLVLLRPREVEALARSLEP